jgi:hypothetical protein
MNTKSENLLLVFKEGGDGELSPLYDSSVSHISNLNLIRKKRIRNVLTVQQTRIKPSANKRDPLKPGAARIPIPCRFAPITGICSGWVKLRKKYQIHELNGTMLGSDSSVLPCTRTLQVRLVTVEGCSGLRFFLFRSLGSTNHKSETAALPCMCPDTLVLREDRPRGYFVLPIA